MQVIQSNYLSFSQNASIGLLCLLHKTEFIFSIDVLLLLLEDKEFSQESVLPLKNSFSTDLLTESKAKFLGKC